LLKRVCARDMERCPVCPQGPLRIIAAITAVRVIRKSLRPLKLAGDPPPIALAHQAAFAWDVSRPYRALRADERPLLGLSLPLVPPSSSVCTPSSVWICPPAALQPAPPWSSWAL
jgi:hypothetical protein